MLPNCSTGRSPDPSSALSPAGLVAELVAFLSTFRLGEVLLVFFSRLLLQGMQVRLLGSGHGLFTRSPVVRILDGIGLILRGILPFIRLARHRVLLADS